MTKVLSSICLTLQTLQRLPRQSSNEPMNKTWNSKSSANKKEEISFDWLACYHKHRSYWKSFILRNLSAVKFNVHVFNFFMPSIIRSSFCCPILQLQLAFCSRDASFKVKRKPDLFRRKERRQPLELWRRSRLRRLRCWDCLWLRRR